jgi:hypothetical protein
MTMRTIPDATHASAAVPARASAQALQADGIPGRRAAVRRVGRPASKLARGHGPGGRRRIRKNAGGGPKVLPGQENRRPLAAARNDEKFPGNAPERGCRPIPGA